MKQIALSIEQMKHLESLGLDTSDASMFWTLKTDYSAKDNYQLTLEFMIDSIPAYTLQDVLDKLPKYIVPFKDGSSLPLIITTTKSGNYAIVYDNPYIKNGRIGFQVSHSLLEASYQMLLWCIENNYIKTNKV